MKSIDVAIFSMIIILSFMFEEIFWVIPFPTSLIIYYLFNHHGVSNIRNGYIMGKIFSILGYITFFGFVFFIVVLLLTDMVVESSFFYVLNMNFSINFKLYLFCLYYCFIINFVFLFLYKFIFGFIFNGFGMSEKGLILYSFINIFLNSSISFVTMKQFFPLINRIKEALVGFGYGYR